jgi:glycosyltransferase involved in cell wall biosynthesis
MTGDAPATVLFPFVGDSIGGSHISALTLVNALPALGVRPVIGLHSDDGPLAPYLRERGIPYDTLPGRVVAGGGLAREVVAICRSGTGLAPLLRARGIGIVHTNDARMHLTWTLAARFAGAAHVWHQRTINPSRRLGLYSRLPARIVAISGYCCAGLPPAMASRARVIDEPFDSTTLTGEAAIAARRRVAQEFGIDEPATIVGFVGNMETQKRPGLFLEMAARYAGMSNTNSHFVMVGDTRGFLSADRQAGLQTGPLAGRLHLAGPRFPVLPFMAAFDVLVAPGVREGLGRTVIEAMLQATSVVAADDGGHREIIENGRTGLLARVDDADDFARCLSRLLGDPGLRAAMAVAGQSAVTQRYDARRHAAAMVNLYGELAADLRY